MKKVSVVISAFNEEKMLPDCLSSLKDLDPEIIVVNNSSTDNTAQIAKKYTDKVFTHKNDPVMLNISKNFGFTKAAGEWIISLDADERLTPELCKEIKSLVNGHMSNVNGYDIPRKNIIFGKWIEHSLWWPDYNLRLFKKGKGKFALKHVHEKLDVVGELGKLENPMIHYNYQTVSQFVNKMNKTYTESEAENFIASGKQIHWYDAIRWPADDFVKTFFFQKGYKDGLHGLVLSQLQAFYALVFFAKVWEKKENFKDLFASRHPEEPFDLTQGKLRDEGSGADFLAAVIKELSRAACDIRYWIYESLIAENPTKKLYYKVRRRLK